MTCPRYRICEIILASKRSHVEVHLSSMVNVPVNLLLVIFFWSFRFSLVYLRAKMPALAPSSTDIRCWKVKIKSLVLETIQEI